MKWQPYTGTSVRVCTQTCIYIYTYIYDRGEWVIKFNALCGTTDSDVHIVHISRVIVAYTLESLSSFTQISHNLQATINFKKIYIENETQKVRGPIKLTLHQFTMTLNL